MEQRQGLKQQFDKNYINSQPEEHVDRKRHARSIEVFDQNEGSSKLSLVFIAFPYIRYAIISFYRYCFTTYQD